VERCQDVILLLGFYHNYDGYYEHIGGHYVTCAGVNSMGLQLGISDPFFDNAEAGGPGRVPVAHNHTANGTGTHNDTQYVSHDSYTVVQIFPLNMPPPPPGCWALQNYPVGAGPPGVNITGFIGQNGGPGWYNPGAPVEVIIEYAVAVSPIAGNATLVGNVTFVGRATPAQWIEPFVVHFFQPGNLSNETGWSPINATTNTTGFFNITGLTAGTYDIGIKGGTGLSELNTSVTLTGGATTPPVDFGTIRVGDANNDDYITIADRTLLYGGWGSSQGGPSWRPYCDFNNDGYLTIADRTLLYGNWGQKGDLAP